MHTLFSASEWDAERESVACDMHPATLIKPFMLESSWLLYTTDQKKLFPSLISHSEVSLLTLISSVSVSYFS